MPLYQGQGARLQVCGVAILAAAAAQGTVSGLELALQLCTARLCQLDLIGTKVLGSAEQVAQEKKAAPVDEENAVLAEIRAVNDSIEDAALSAQIDRIGVITAKIFEYQKSHPERSAQLHAFLSYYLPTTLKILRAYAQLESQGVEGENIAAAMSRIEGMMGKVVEGFEKQLDQLFQGDAMDITTDVAVLEQMLQKDGLSSSGGMQIGI